MTWIADNEMGNIRSALDKILAAKHIWEVKRIRLRSDLPFWRNSDGYMDITFLIEALKVTFELEEVTILERVDRYGSDGNQFVFSLPFWKRIASVYSDLSNEEKDELESILKRHSSFADTFECYEGRIIFSVGGNVAVTLDNYYFMGYSKVIEELLDLEKALVTFEQDVQRRSRVEMEEIV